MTRAKNTRDAIHMEKRYLYMQLEQIERLANVHGEVAETFCKEDFEKGADILTEVYDHILDITTLLEDYLELKIVVDFEE